METKKLLVVLPGLPWPARDNGIAIRYYPVIKALAERHSIDLLAYDEERASIPDDPLREKLDRVERYAFRLASMSKIRKLLTRLKILNPFGTADCVTFPYTYLVREVVEKAIRRTQYDAILWVGKHSEVIDSIRPHFGGRIVMDAIDSLYLHKLRAYKEPSLKQRLELWQLKQWEQALLKKCDELIYISNVDAGAATEGDIKCAVIPNAVYAPDFIYGTGDRNTIGFLGNMAYKPNVEAALRLHDRIFVPLKKQFPDLKLKIIGRDPVPSIQALASADVIVTGTVQNIWEHVAEVGTFVFPMASGSGLQNKLIEVMYAGKPAITTEICRASLGALNERDLLLGDSDAELIEQTSRAITDDTLRSRLAEKGREYVSMTFAMDAVVKAFERCALQATFYEESPAIPQSQSIAV